MRDLNAIALNGKRILLRIDINSPMEDGRVVLNPRFREHAKTIQQLSARRARLIVLSHQGRRGKPDLISLEQHAVWLEKLTGIPVRFVKDVTGEMACRAIAGLKDGEILLLDNVRFMEDEESKEPGTATIVRALSPLVDMFVLDAFSIAHRSHASVVGFATCMPAYPGPVLAREIEALKQANRGEKVTFIIGGSKIHDAYLILKRWLRLGKVDRVLLGGVPGILGMFVRGYDVGKSHGMLTHGHTMEERGEMEELFKEFDGRIQLPLDVGIERDGKRREDVSVANVDNGEIKDIGKATIARYCKEIQDAKLIIMNGSPGVYEENGFGKGTEAILRAIADSKAYSLIGGGHTISAIEKFNIPKERFGYISLSGKAFLEYLEGKELPALKALEENAGLKFEGNG